jgi:hypothetical protein
VLFLPGPWRGISRARAGRLLVLATFTNRAPRDWRPWVVTRAAVNCSSPRALGLMIILNFSLSTTFGSKVVPVLLVRCTRVPLKLPVHCVRYVMRTGSAYCAAFAFCQDGTRAIPYLHSSAANIRLIPCFTCHFLNARAPAANASTCQLAARAADGISQKTRVQSQAENKVDDGQETREKDCTK